jgi:acyl carrier protein
MNRLSQFLKELFLPQTVTREEAASQARKAFNDFPPQLTEKTLFIISDTISVPPKMMFPNTRFIEDLQCTELEPVELVMAFEEKFKIKIPDSEAENIFTVGDLVNYLRLKTNNTELASPNVSGGTPSP